MVSLLVLNSYVFPGNQFSIVEENYLANNHSDIRNSHKGIYLHKGEIYQKAQVIDKTIIHYSNNIDISIDNGSIVSNYDASIDILEISLPELVTKNKISGKEQYTFDMSALDSAIKTIYLASYSQKAFELSRTTPVHLVTNLNQLFPQNTMRVVIPGYLTTIIEKSDLVDLPVTNYSYNTNIYKSQHVSIMGNRYLVDRNDFVSVVDDQYNFIGSPPASAIPLGEDKVLSVNHYGEGMVTSLGSMKKKETYLTVVAILVISILVTSNLIILFLLIKFRGKIISRLTRTNVTPPPISEINFVQLKESLARFDSLTRKLEPNSFSQTYQDHPQKGIANSGDISRSDLMSLLDSEEHSQIEQASTPKDGLPNPISAISTEGHEDPTSAPILNPSVSGESDLDSTINQTGDDILRVNSEDALVRSHFEILEFIMAVQIEIVNLLEDWQKYSATNSEYYMLNLIVGNYFVKSNTSHFPKWFSIMEEIDGRGLVFDLELIRNLQNTATGDENLTNLEKILYYELYSIIISPFCIMLEELRNFNKFVNAESSFTKINEKIGNRIKEFQELVSQNIGISIHYVPLFTHYTQHKNIAAVEDIDGFIYKTVSVNKDMISQIISFGLKSVWGNTPTEVRISR
jgi:hypothetical protein